MLTIYCFAAQGNGGSVLDNILWKEWLGLEFSAIGKKKVEHNKDLIYQVVQFDATSDG